MQYRKLGTTGTGSPLARGRLTRDWDEAAERAETARLEAPDRARPIAGFA